MKYIILRVMNVSAYCYGCLEQCSNECGTQCGKDTSR